MLAMMGKEYEVKDLGHKERLSLLALVLFFRSLRHGNGMLLCERQLLRLSLLAFSSGTASPSCMCLLPVSPYKSLQSLDCDMYPDLLSCRLFLFFGVTVTSDSGCGSFTRFGVVFTCHWQKKPRVLRKATPKLLYAFLGYLG